MAALDASIITGIKPLNLAQPDPIDRYVKLAGVQEMQGKLADQERTRADDEAVREAYKQSGGDSATLRKLLTGRGAYKQIQALDKAELEKQEKQSTISKNTAQGNKATWEIDRDKLQNGAALLNEAKDPQSWETVLRVGETSGIFKPEVVAQWRAQGYSPQLVQSLQSAGITRAQQLTEQGNAATRAETGRHNVATEATARGQLGVAQGQLGVSRERLTMEKNAPKGQYDAERGILVDPRTGTAQPVTVGGQPLGQKPDAASRKELMSINQQESTIDGALAAVKATPSAFGTMRGAATMVGPMTESAVGKLDTSAERTARSYVFNVVSKVINERAGAAQSAQELARLRSFLPAETDNAEQITDKLGGFKTYLSDMRAGTTGAAAPTPAPTPPKKFISLPDPAQYRGKSIRSDDDGVIYTSDGKTWKRQ